LTCTFFCDGVVNNIELRVALNGFSDSKALGFLDSAVVASDTTFTRLFSLGSTLGVGFLSCTVFTKDGSDEDEELCDPKLTKGV